MPARAVSTGLPRSAATSDCPRASAAASRSSATPRRSSTGASRAAATTAPRPTCARCPTCRSASAAAASSRVHLVDHPIATDPALDRHAARLARARRDLDRHPAPPLGQSTARRGSEYFQQLRRQSSDRAGAGQDRQPDRDDREPRSAAAPIVYRAGRYGVGPNTAALLEEAGYRADVSVRALFDYGDEGGPDFSRVKPCPFRVGDGALVELPLSAAYVGRLRGAGEGPLPRRRPAAARPRPAVAHRAAQPGAADSGGRSARRGAGGGTRR